MELAAVNKPTFRKLAEFGAMLAVVSGTLAYCIHAKGESDAARDRQRQEDAAAKAVTSLPPGIEDQWLAYVDRRTGESLSRVGNSLRVADVWNRALGATTLVSINSPYKVACDSIMGGSVTFGYGDSAVVVYIYGLLALGPNVEKAPALGVSPSSIAARELSKTLCERIDARVQATVTQ